MGMRLIFSFSTFNPLGVTNAGSVGPTRSDFLDLGSTHAIGIAIQRLLQASKLRRVAHGLYDISRKHRLLGELSASSDAIAAAIARRDGIRLQTTEAAVANLLNLSEQVPGRIVYVANRRRRSVKMGAAHHRVSRAFAAQDGGEPSERTGHGGVARGRSAAGDAGAVGAFAKIIDTGGPPPVAARPAICAGLDALTSAVHCR